MSCIVPRTCSEVPQDDVESVRRAVSRPLAAFRAASAYVLLGDPGSGKTTSFKAEHDALGEEACLVTARDFLALEPDAHPELRGKTLFIDGLDEVRAGGGDARTPFDALRGRLDTLGKPRFRLSCREADWLGTNDRVNLAKVSSDANLTVLRLDPLTEDDIKRILNARSGIDDVRSFMATAKEKGVAGFLDNPQCLGMLSDVVTSGGGWPESRRELFEQACRRMAREHNEGHMAAAEWSSAPAAISEDELLDAARRLCAVLLMSGSDGCAISSRRESTDYPGLHHCAPEHRERCGQAVSTKLFTAVAEGRFRPVHRHVAEFLGGRYVARLLDGKGLGGPRGRCGVPVRRILALITGGDGGVVTELRGLSAWIAAFSRPARHEFIERDPIGVGLYGDIGAFSLREKRDLLTSLERESSRLHLANGTSVAFSPLATSDMQPVIEEVLCDTARQPEHQSFVRFVLGVLQHGSKLPGLADTLFALVCDSTWSPDVNALALGAFLEQCPDSAKKTDRLKMLLADVHAGGVPDPLEELRGILLSRLYPRYVPPSEVWNYLVAAEGRAQFGSYWSFWSQQILHESLDEEVIELLDSLRRQSPNVRSALESRQNIRQTPTELLNRALHSRGGVTDTRRLYDWLRTGVSAVRDETWAHHHSVREIRRWLEHRPGVQKAVFMEGLHRCAASADFSRQAFELRNCLYGARRAPDFGLWCLKQAVSLAGTRLEVAEHLLWEAFQAHKDRDGNEDLSLDVLMSHVRQEEKLRPRWERMIHPRSLSEDPVERKSFPEDQQQREDEWLAHVQSRVVALAENRAEPVLLFRMARAYFGDFVNFSAEDGWRAVQKLLRGDPILTRAALMGLRGTIDRSELPDVEEILELRRQDRVHSIGLPFLAGLAEVERTSSEDPFPWDEARILRALTLYYVTPHAHYSPRWHQRLLHQRPELVADALVPVVVSGLHSDEPDAALLRALAHNPWYAQVAQHAVVRLLVAFPTRCTLKQISALDYLLWAALEHADPAQLRSLIDGRLTKRSMNDAQRVRWLACGFLALPTQYESCLRDFVEGREGRVRHLVSFVLGEEPLPLLHRQLDSRVVKLLIALVGPYSEPDVWWQGGVVTLAMRASQRVTGMIYGLADTPYADPDAVLEELAAEPKLSRWRPALLQAKDDQRRVRRDAAYRHPDVDQICRTLDDGPPANSADLAALVTDRLSELGDRIRNDNANGWRPFWNEDKARHPYTPKHEESCRDPLLKELRHWLPAEADVQPERRYANDKRADICVSCRDFQIPVEIKKNSHPKLWSALRNQLMAQYTRDPATDGYGIYLVLWFGEIEKHRTPPPPSGVRPDSPEALRARLEETLKPEDARKISVCVIDVSAPPDKNRKR